MEMKQLKNMKWKQLSTEYLIKRPWLTARRDKVELPDGRVIDEYYVLEYPSWINVIAVTKDNQMVLVRQYRHALGCTNFEVVAGVVEEGESPLHAAQRELLEETGFGGGEWQEIMEVHLFSKEEVLQKLKNGDFIQSLMVAPLWKFFFGM